MQRCGTCRELLVLILWMGPRSGLVSLVSACVYRFVYGQPYSNTDHSNHSVPMDVHYFNRGALCLSPRRPAPREAASALPSDSLTISECYSHIG